MMGFLIGIIAIVALYIIINKLWCFWCRSKVCLVGKTAIVTGGASGIGYEVALALASKGCRVLIADIANLSRATEEIQKKTHNPNILGKNIDLRSFKSVREFAKDIISTEQRLDILVCNAGIADYRERHITEDGLERTMQVNYFSHFLLVHLLLDLLKKSSPSRITFTSSLMAYISNLTIENLTPGADYYKKKYSIFSGGTYSNSKLCCAGAAKSFGEKLKGSGVTANAVQVGGVKTPIFWKAIKGDGNYYALFLGGIVYSYGKTPEEGAQTLIHLAHSDEVKNITGQSFFEGMQFFRPPQLTQQFCDKLWQASIECTKLQSEEVKC